MIATIPHGLDAIIKTFGSIDDPDFERKHIVSFDLPFPLTYDGKPVTRARCHRLAVDHFTLALDMLESIGHLDLEFNGICARRSIRGHASFPSAHSWGIAADFMASQYPLGSHKRWPDTVIQCFKEAGFFYGGDFQSRKDPMHVQLCTGY